MKTKALADWLGVSDSTIRLWAREEFRQYMSPSAQGNGLTRNFTDMDARILALIAERRNDGVHIKEIHVELTRLQEEDWKHLPEMPAAPPGQGPIAMIPRETAETKVEQQRQALMREISILQARIVNLDEELKGERVAHDATRDELIKTKERLGTLQGRLETIDSEREMERSTAKDEREREREVWQTERERERETWLNERQMLQRIMITIVVVAAILLAIILLLSLSGGLVATG